MPTPLQGHDRRGSGPGFATHFVESVVLTWGGNLLRIAVGILALRLVTSSISEAELGAYWVLTAVSALLAGFADLGVGTSAVRHLPIAPSPGRVRGLIHTFLLLRLSVLVLVCLLVLACKPWVLRLFAAQVIEQKYHYLYILIILVSLNELYTNFLQGLNRFRVIAALELVTSVLRFGLILAFVARGGRGVEGLFLAEAVAPAVAVALAARVLAHGWPGQATRSDAIEQLRFGLPLYLNSLLGTVASRINTLLIGSLRGTMAVSHFSVVARVPDQLGGILRSFNFVYLPNMSRFLAQDDDRAARQLLTTSLRLLSFVFALLALLLAFFRRELIGLLAPPSYQVTAPALPFLLGSLIFASLGSVMGSTLVAMGDSRTPVKINFWTSVLGIGVNWYLIRGWGFMGAAWALCLYMGVGYVITDIVLTRRIRPQSRSYLGLLAFLAGILLLGLHAGVLVRLALLAAALGGSLLLSGGLRGDVVRVWRAVRARRAAAARGAALLDPEP